MIRMTNVICLGLFVVLGSCDLKQETSRLPFGALEEFVYSNNRHTLLSTWNNTMKLQDYIYYKMLQTENELSDMDLTADHSMQMNELQEMIESLPKQTTIDTRIKDLIFRNQFRQLFDYKMYDNKTIHEILDTLQKELALKFNHYSKPKDPSKGIQHDNNDVDDTRSDDVQYMTESTLKQQLSDKFEAAFNSSRYKSTLIPWILNHKYSALMREPKKAMHLLQTPKMAFYPDEAAALLMGLSQKYLKESKYREIAKIIKYLPIKHTKRLMQHFAGKELNQGYFEEILMQYLEKLVPNELALFKGQSWSKHDVIPMGLKWKYIQILYKETRDVLWNDDVQYLNADVLYQYIVFCEENYYRLGLKYPYDIGIVMQLLDLLQQHKRQLLKRHNIKTPFQDVPRLDWILLQRLMQRFIEFLHSKDGKEYYVQFNNDLRYFFQSTQQYKDSNITRDFKDYTFLVSTQMLQSAEINTKLREGYNIKDIQMNYDSINMDDGTLIEFDSKKNPSSFGMDEEEINIFVNVRNVNDILVKWFEINTRSYYRDNKKPISTALNLDGLSASIEYVIKQKDFELKTKYHETQIVIQFPRELLHKRGVYFLDLLSNGIHSRAIINIGTIKYITKICEAGHLFILLDENNEVINNGSILLNKHIYKTSHETDTHSILIPFTNKPNDKQSIILQREDDPNFNVVSTFVHESESYLLKCGFYIDREQILSQRKANIMVRCGLFLNKNKISLSVLQNTRLDIELNTANFDLMDINKAFDTFALYDDKESIVRIDIPDKIQFIEIILYSSIEKISTAKSQNRIQSFTQTNVFEVNHVHDTMDIAQIFLIPQVDHRYIVALCGRNGEAISNQKLTTYLYPKDINQYTMIRNDLVTDEFGQIYIPNLEQRFQKLRVFTNNNIKIDKTWNLETRMDFVRVPRFVNLLSGETVSIPYIPATQTQAPLFALFDYHFSEKYGTKHVKYNAKTSQIEISDLEIGKYVLKILDVEYDINIRVVEKGTVLNVDDVWFNIYRNQVTSLSASNRLQIEYLQYDEANNVINIKLNGVNERTRIHVIATHLLPAFDVKRWLFRDVSVPNEKRSFFGSKMNYYLTQREIDEEYRYVLEREQSPKYPGNALKKPSFLVKPLEIGGTTTATQDAAKGGEFKHEEVGGTHTFSADDEDDLDEDYNYDESRFEDRAFGDHPLDPFNIDFLSANGSITIYNMVPNSDGVVTVNIKSMYQTNQNFLKIIAFDEKQIAIKTHCLHNRRIKKTNDNKLKHEMQDIPEWDQYVDNRLMVGLNPRYQYIDAYDIIPLNQAPHHYNIIDFKSSQIGIYSTFDEIFDLLITISGNSQLNKWSFLKQWHTFNRIEKLEKYDTFFSHELHLFLMRNDVTFFNEVCLIHIKSKLYKDFMDYYFIQDHDALTSYLNMGKLQQLNILEQMLLAQVFRNEHHSVLKYTEHDSCYNTFKYESLQIDRKQFNTLFQTALYKGDEPTAAPTSDPTTNPTKNPTSDPTQPPTNAPSQAPSIAPSSSKRARRRMKSTTRRKERAAPRVYDSFGGYAQHRTKMKEVKYFEQIQKTKEYKETTFWNMKYKKDFMSLNSFWCDFAIWSLDNDEKKKDSAFLSRWFMIATSSVNEMLFVLSLIDLPFNNRHNLVEFVHNNKKDWNNNVTLVTSLPSILFIKQLKKSIATEHEDEERVSSVLIYSHYFDPNDRYHEQINSDAYVSKEKFVESNAFIVGKIYGVQVILISVVSYEQKLNILTQIPTGSIPIGKRSFRTKTHIFALSPYAVQKFEYFFYFPIIGTFQIYPIIVSHPDTQQIIASFNVNNEENNQIIVQYTHTASDKVTNIESWNDVSLNGDYDEVIQYLSTHNLYKTSLSRIYYKLSQSLEFYDNIIHLLRNKYFYDEVIWSFQIFWIQQITMCHNAHEYELKSQSFNDRFDILLEYISIHYTSNKFGINAFDPYYKSHHFVYDNMEQNKYDYKEYIPLVNARKYALGEKRNILNDKLKTQYEMFLLRISYQSHSVTTLAPRELISATYYLLLQDRIDEAIDIYQIIKGNKEYSEDEMYSNPLYAYLIGYMSLYEYDNHQNIISIISDINNRYCNVSLIESKRKLMHEFDALLQDIVDVNKITTANVLNSDNNLEEINRNKVLNAEEFVNFEINSEDNRISIQSQNVNHLDINFYTINMEVLFSMNPSILLPSSQSLESTNAVFSYITPKQTISVDIDSNNDVMETEILIPNELKNGNIFIQIIASTMMVSKPYNDNQLMIQIQENKGKLKILTRGENNKLLFVNKAYVKVYSKIKNTSNKYKFYKDGYSDIRGLFDYVSLSTDDLEHTEKFVLFIKHEQFGCTVKEANVPTR